MVGVCHVCTFGADRNSRMGIAGVAFGLIADLPVFFRICALIAIAALPLVLLILWKGSASQKRRA